MLHRS